jgi:hypothetical protein
MAMIPDDFIFHLLQQLTCAAKETGRESLLEDADRLRSFLDVTREQNPRLPRVNGKRHA